MGSKKMAVSDNQLVVSIVKQNALREALEECFARSGFVQYYAGPNDGAIVSPFGAGNSVGVLLATVGRYDRGFHIPHSQGLGCGDQPLPKFGSILGAMTAKQRFRVAQDLRSRNAEQFAGSFADVGVVNLPI